jgi:hypothetical protein
MTSLDSVLLGIFESDIPQVWKKNPTVTLNFFFRKSFFVFGGEQVAINQFI